MMQDLFDRQSRARGKPRRGVIGMAVADEHFGLHAIELLQIGGGFFEQRQAARRRQIADMGRDDGAVLPAERDRRLELPAEREHRP